MTTKNAKIVVPAQRKPSDATLAAAVNRVRASMPEPLIFQQVKEKLGFDPSAPVKVPARTNAKRDRQRASRLTDRVWKSINPDGTFNEALAIPSHVTNTRELAVIAQRSDN